MSKFSYVLMLTVSIYSSQVFTQEASILDCNDKASIDVKSVSRILATQINDLDKVDDETVSGNRWAQGIWKLQDDLFLVSEDPDGKDYQRILFHLINSQGDILKTFNIKSPDGKVKMTHAQSLYVKKISNYSYDVYTENGSRDGLSLFRLQLGKVIKNSIMSFTRDIIPKLASGKSLFFHVFAMNTHSNLIVTGTASSKGLIIQRYSSESFLKGTSRTNRYSDNSVATPMYRPIRIQNFSGLQGIALQGGSVYILAGKLSDAATNTRIYSVSFRELILNEYTFKKLWQAGQKAEPEGLYLQGNELIFGVHGWEKENLTQQTSNSKNKKILKLFSTKLRPL